MLAWLSEGNKGFSSQIRRLEENGGIHYYIKHLILVFAEQWRFFKEIRA